MYIRTDGRTFETHFIMATQKSRPKNREEGSGKPPTRLPYTWYGQQNGTRL